MCGRSLHMHWTLRDRREVYKIALHKVWRASCGFTSDHLLIADLQLTPAESSGKRGEFEDLLKSEVVAWSPICSFYHTSILQWCVFSNISKNVWHTTKSQSQRALFWHYIVGGRKKVFLCFDVKRLLSAPFHMDKENIFSLSLPLSPSLLLSDRAA